MSQSASRNLLKSLAEEVGRATSSCTTFAVAGDLPAIDPKLVVDTVGAVPFPLQQALARKLKTTGAVAPYGKGTRTFVDPTVRKTLEIDASRVQLGDDWNRAIAAATRSAAQRMGLPAAHVEPILYKLLIYERGGFFLPHRDSEKHDRMVASLIVVLPNSFEGGQLIVRHAGQSESFDFYPARRVEHPAYAAFYADCEHEVKPVSYGLRVCLAYNLVLNPSAPKPVVPPPAADPLTGAMRDWVAAHPTEPLVFAFDHEYTTRGPRPRRPDRRGRRTGRVPRPSRPTLPARLPQRVRRLRIRLQQGATVEYRDGIRNRGLDRSGVLRRNLGRIGRKTATLGRNAARPCRRRGEPAVRRMDSR
jgi:predicted 2-oxoglutarate/Fe(II)-dependent dioxygenase YbiX